MAKRGSGKGSRGARKGRSRGAGGGLHGGDASEVALAAPVERAATARAERGDGTRRSADDKAARRSGKGKRAGIDRADAELRRIERGLVEAQVILSEVAARADALEERLRVITGHGLRGAGGQIPSDAETESSPGTTVAPAPGLTPGPETGAAPAPEAVPVPGEAPVPEGAPARDAVPASGTTPVTDTGPGEAVPAPDPPAARWRGLPF
ncbi:MAG: hypothetical protein ACP5VP_11105 [Candidatus Limnocylindrales bacterium]